MMEWRRPFPRIAVLFLLVFSFWTSDALALLDQFQGDSAIYSASSEYLRPNVLFIVDNSAAMSQKGSREPFDPDVTYLGEHVSNRVYVRQQATGGTITYNEYIDAVDDVTCTDANAALADTGFYAGPLKKNDGSCNAPQAGNYFTGNLLNYINAANEAGTWQAETAYAQGDLVQPTTPATDSNGENIIYRAIVGGSSAATEPASWPTTHGETFSDGTVTWRTLVKTWQPETVYQVGDIVIPTTPITLEDGSEAEYECITAGTSGTSEPDWPTTTGQTIQVTESVTPEWALSGNVIDMVKTTLKLVLRGARNSVKFGVMVFGKNNSGGSIQAYESGTTLYQAPVREVDSGTTAGIDAYNELMVAIDNLSLIGANTNQPVNEALWDASLYWKGQYDSSARLGSDLISGQGPYPKPYDYSCQKNFIIALTTGSTPNNAKTKNIIGDLDANGISGDVRDAAKMLYENDWDPSTVEEERVQTHIIQLMTARNEVLEEAVNASHGRGDYYQVNNSNELAQALYDAMTNIVLESDTSFVAPVVPTSPENRTYSGERVYLGFFKPISQRPWHGNLKKYGIDLYSRIIDRNGNLATLDDGSFNIAASSFWSTTNDAGRVEEGGAGEELLLRDFAMDPRKIYTYKGNSDLNDSSNVFSSANITAAELGINSGDATADDAARDKLIDYIYGYDAYDDDGDGTYGAPGNGEKRDWILGDILHSKPQIINYNHYTFTEANEAHVTGTGASSSCTYNKTMIYVGTNDGMLHAFRDCDGKEAWAFIPDNLLPNLPELGKRPAKHTFFTDSSPAVYIYDKDQDGNIGVYDTSGGSDDKVILIMGQRRGGDAYYALDVTNPLDPQLMWKIDSSTSGFEELGETWSAPQIGHVKVTDGGVTKEKIVAFFGAGYDKNEDGRYGSTVYFTDPSSEDKGEGEVTSSGSTVPGSQPGPKGRGVYAVEIATMVSGEPSFSTADPPNKVWDYVPADNSWLKFSIPSDLTILDSNYDGLIDRIYAGDTGGRMWRFSLSGTDASAWSGEVIAFTGSFPSYPEARGQKIFYRPSVALESGYTMVAFGTGDRAHPLNTALTDRFYMIKDRGQVSTDTISSVEGDLVDLTENVLQLNDEDATARNATLDALNSPSNYGWFIDLDRTHSGSVHAGEKVLASPLIFNKVAYFTTYTPNVSTSTTDPCSPGNLGVSRLYAVDYKTGEAVLNFNDGNDEDPTDHNARALSDADKVLRRSDREITLGVGIPSGLVVVMPPSGDAKLLIGCGGGLCTEDPKIGGTIIPIYWMQW